MGFCTAACGLWMMMMFVSCNYSALSLLAEKSLEDWWATCHWSHCYYGPPCGEHHLSKDRNVEWGPTCPSLAAPIRPSFVSSLTIPLMRPARPDKLTTRVAQFVCDCSGIREHCSLPAPGGINQGLNSPTSGIRLDLRRLRSDLQRPADPPLFLRTIVLMTWDPSPTSDSDAGPRTWDPALNILYIIITAGS